MPYDEIMKILGNQFLRGGENINRKEHVNRIVGYLRGLEGIGKHDWEIVSILINRQFWAKEDELERGLQFDPVSSKAVENQVIREESRWKN